MTKPTARTIDVLKAIVLLKIKFVTSGLSAKEHQLYGISGPLSNEKDGLV